MSLPILFSHASDVSLSYTDRDGFSTPGTLSPPTVVVEARGREEKNMLLGWGNQKENENQDQEQEEQEKHRNKKKGSRLKGKKNRETNQLQKKRKSIETRRDPRERHCSKVLDLKKRRAGVYLLSYIYTKQKTVLHK